jgi:hypothetical protein
MAFSRWISMRKNRVKKLITSIFSLYSTWFIPQISVGLLVIPSRNCNCHGQHGHGGVFFTKLKKEATRQQSTKKKLPRLLAIIWILRLVPRYYWLVVVLSQNERCHGRSDAWRFCFCCLMPDARTRKRFWSICARVFCEKELQRWTWRGIGGGSLFFMTI